MRLESALYSSKEGLTAHGQAIAVVGDNIANASTTGYKTSRVEFADLMADGGGGPQTGSLAQAGSGAQISKVRAIQDTGVVDFTGRSLDVGIGGKGFFTVSDGTSQYYTRAGNFQIGSDGTLQTADGMQVMGFAGPESTELKALNINDARAAATPTSAVSIYGNLDSRAQVTTAPNAPATFNEINDAASFTRGITVYDAQGGSHSVVLGFFKTDTNKFSVQAYMDGGDVSGGTKGVPTKLGTPVDMTFSDAGVITGTPSLTLAPAYSNGAAAGNFTVDLKGFSQYAAGNNVSSLTQDGKGSGQIKDYEFRSDGSFYAVMGNGDTSLIGIVPVAMFKNQEGLERSGSTLFRQGATAGDPTMTRPGSEGAGTLQGSSLERSTVDIASQFTDLVVFQRGYQASSQTLNAAVGLMRDTIQLIR